MSKNLLVGLAILAFSTSAASAAHHRTHHHHATNQPAVAGATPLVGAPPAAVWMGGVSKEDREMYARNLRESGYNPKNNFNANGTLVTQ
jgi:hypothetical protein